MALQNAFANLAMDQTVQEAVTHLENIKNRLPAALDADRLKVSLPSLPAGTNNIGYTSPSVSQKVAQGRVMLSGSGRMTLAVSGNVRAIFANPAGSGRTVSVIRISGLATSNTWLSLFLNPTVGVPGGTARPVLNAVAGGGLSPLATFRADTNTTALAAGTGVDTGLVIGMGGGSRMTLDLPPIVLAAGVSLGVNAPFSGAGDCSLAIYWIED